MKIKIDVPFQNIKDKEYLKYLIEKLVDEHYEIINEWVKKNEV